MKPQKRVAIALCVLMSATAVPVLLAECVTSFATQSCQYEICYCPIWMAINSTCDIQPWTPYEVWVRCSSTRSNEYGIGPVGPYREGVESGGCGVYQYLYSNQGFSCVLVGEEQCDCSASPGPGANWISTTESCNRAAKFDCN